MHASAIFQRTESGRSEIKNKMHGLTQSERLALIVIDGLSTYGDLKLKLKGLTEERFERAVLKLLHKSLIFEILLAEENAIADEFDAKTVDQFLQQDPLDPVTIMSIDPEEEFDLDMGAENLSSPQFRTVATKLENTNLPAGIRPSPKTLNKLPESVKDEHIYAPQAKTPLKISSVDFYVPLEIPNSATVIFQPTSPFATNAERLLTTNASFNEMDNSNGVPAVVAVPKFGWGVILMIGGLIIIIGSIFLTYRH